MSSLRSKSFNEIEEKLKKHNNTTFQKIIQESEEGEELNENFSDITQELLDILLNKDLITKQAEEQFEKFKKECKDWKKKDDDTSVWDTIIDGNIPFSEYFHILRERYFQEKKLNELIKENQNSSKVQEALRKLKPEKYTALAAGVGTLGAVATAFGAGFIGKALFDNSFQAATHTAATNTWIAPTPTVTSTVNGAQTTTFGTDGHYVNTPATDTPEIPGHIDSGEALLISLIVIVGVAVTAYVVYNLSQTAKYERKDKNKLETIDIDNLQGKSLDKINKEIKNAEQHTNIAKRVIRNKDGQGFGEYVFGL